MAFIRTITQIYRRALVICLLLGGPLMVLIKPAAAQNVSTENKKARKLFFEGMNNFSSRQFEKGLSNLQKAAKEDTSFYEAWYYLGKTYEILQDGEKANEAFLNYLKIKPDPEIHNKVAAYFMERGNYTKAEEAYQLIAENQHTKPPEKIAAQRQLKNIAYAQQAMAQPIDIEVERLPSQIIIKALQYTPSLTADKTELYFTARDRKEEENIYVAELINNNWTSPKPVPGDINQAGNQGTAAVSADGKNMVLAAQMPRQGFGNIDIYAAQRHGNQWSQLENLGAYVNTYSWDSQPTLSADGRILVFSSERTGGVGRKDLYITYNTPSGWTKPTNLGKQINTPLNEISPFLHPNGTSLFFASDGHIGLGSYDLYYTNQTDTGWTKPTNLGYPINTYRGETTIFITADATEAYISTSPTGKKYVDSALIARFDWPAQLQLTATQVVIGKVTHALNKTPLGCSIELVVTQGGNTKYLYTTHSDPETGKYQITLPEGNDYGLFFDKKNYLPIDKYIDVKKATKTPINLNVSLQPAAKNAVTSLQNIFFETGSHQIKPASTAALNRIGSFLVNNPNINIEISGHTDDVGTLANNLHLSQKRAKAVYDYLTGKKSDLANRLTHKGYGETKPAVPNNSNANRALNRRIEFKITNL